MSVIINQTHKVPRFGSGGRRTLVQAALSAAAGFIRGAVLRAARLIVVAAEVVAEARMRRAMIESEIYRNRYRDRVASVDSEMRGN
jgi:hypothetical protein